MENILRKIGLKTGLVAITCGGLCTAVQANCPADAEAEIRDAMKTVTQYMMDSVSYRGGFVWEYLPDLSRSWGEMEAKRTMAWVQPPGTPSVGHVLLDAYHATGDEYYYEAAEQVANALIWGQLECGGWNYMFDFAGENSLKEWYRTIGKNGWRLEEFHHYYGNATFDDSGTMEAAKFLLRMYVEKNDPVYRAPLEKVIHLVLESQYPSGGWPQRYPLRYDHPFQGQADYSSFITLNDDVIPDIIDFLIQCHQAIGLQNVKEPILRAMYLMIVLQQGEPYAGWADQYTVEDLKPAHARSYEPRSINTGITAGMIRKMLEYYKLTADTRFLSGIPAAIRFLQSQELPASEVKKWHRRARSEEDILVARFVDPDTGKPLYVHRKGSNIHNGTYYIDQNLEATIAHYSSATFVNPSALQREYEDVRKLDRQTLIASSPLMSDQLVPLPKYYSQIPPQLATAEEINRIVTQAKQEKCWFAPLGTISNPYKEYQGEGIPYSEYAYSRTMVGDEYDTSPYPCEENITAISVKRYIRNMTILIRQLTGDAEQ